MREQRNETRPEPDMALHELELLGVQEFVHAGGPKSTMGGALLHDSVVAAMSAMSSRFVDVAELNDAVGRLASSVFGSKDAIVVAGAASGCVLAAKACVDKLLEGRDGARAGGPAIITQRRHYGRYTYLYKQAGCRVVEVGTINDCQLVEYERAIDADTAGIAWLEGPGIFSAGATLGEVCGLAKRHGVPVLVDAAAMALPKHRIGSYLDAGSSLVVVSGGKMIGGPQNSGLVLGERELVRLVAGQIAPHLGLGRGHKLSKEVLIGLSVALRRFDSLKDDELLGAYADRMRALIPKFAALGYQGEVMHDDRHLIPSLVFRCATEQFGFAPAAVNRKLINRCPRVYVPYDNRRDEVWINPISLRAGDEELVLAAFTALTEADGAGA